MKKYVGVLSALLGIVAFTACDKQSNQLADTESITMTAQDDATMEDVIADIETQVDYNVDFRSGGDDDCPTVTVDPEDGSFPKTITIDFGDSCEGPFGKVRAGQIIVTQTAPMYEAGAQRTITFQNFSINGAQIDGSKTLTNNGVNDEGQSSFTREVSGLVITYPDGTSSSLDASWTRTWTEGFDTDFWMDDVFSITGSASGVNRNGVAFSSEIIEPLIKKRVCLWIVSGVKQVTKGDETFSIDFGDGTCDRQATLTLPNGETKEINLHWWFN